MNIFKNKFVVILLLFAALFLFFIFAVIAFMFKNKNEKDKFIIKDCVKQIGTAQNLTGTKKGVNYDIKFPYFNYKEVDAVVHREIYGEIEKFIKEKIEQENKDKGKDKNEDKVATLLSDFQTFSFKEDRGASLQMCYLKKFKDKEIQKTKTLVFCQGKHLKAENIFKQDKIEDVVSAIINAIKSDRYLSDIVKKDGVDLKEKLPCDIKTLENFAIKENAVMFSFDGGRLFKPQYGIISVTVPNSSIREAFSNFYFDVNPKEGGGIKDLKKSGKFLVALTFDDGPVQGPTDIILDELKKHDARATFFVVGENAQKNPELLKRELDEGHEIGNHTFSHKTLTHLSKENIEKQIEATNDVVQNIIGIKPKLVRVPGGALNKRICEYIKYPIINWEVDTRDWQTKNTNSTVKCVLRETCDGAIVLMHDKENSTAEAVKEIIPELKRKGFELVTVSELFRLNGIEIENSKEYTKAKKVKEKVEKESEEEEKEEDMSA